MSASPEQPHSFSPEEIAQRIEHFGATFDLDVMKQAASLIRAQSERIAKLETPEWFYSVEDPEYRSGGDVQDVVDDMDHEGVMEVAGAREVWKKWVAVRCVSIDDEGDIDETEAATFNTAEEADKCWPESLAACRAQALTKAQP